VLDDRSRTGWRTKVSRRIYVERDAYSFYVLEFLNEEVIDDMHNKIQEGANTVK